jgi:hypothetical protein
MPSSELESKPQRGLNPAGPARQSGEEQHAVVEEAPPVRGLMADPVSPSAGAAAAERHATRLSRAASGRAGQVSPAVLRLQRRYGNRHVQRVMEILREQEVPEQRDTVQRPPPGDFTAIPRGDQRPGAVARQLVPAAETRARTAQHSWAPLDPALRTRLERMAADRSQRAAVLREMWDAIRGGLTHAGRVTVELTTSLGVVNGQQVARVGMGQGVTLAYVNATPRCAALRDDTRLSDHRAVHQTGAAAQIRAIIQVNPNIFHTAASEAVSNLYSLLRHEYIHVEQSIARGVHQGVRFVVAGSREFLSEEELVPAERQAVEGLDEIEALCAEIENATSTGLDVSFSMRNTIDYLWSAYENYHDALSDPRTQIDRQIARRVLRDLRTGTRALMDYLRSPAAQWLTPSLRNDARRPPQGFEGSKIVPYIRRGSAPASGS